MSFDVVQYGVPGDEKVTAASAIGGLPLGARLILEDGRIFAHAKATASSSLAAGKLYVQPAVVAGHGGVAGSGLITATTSATILPSALGDKVINITCGGTSAVTANQYAEGFLTFQAGTAGIGHIYKIKENTAALTTVAFTVTLVDTDPIAATIACGTTTVGLRVNPLSGITISGGASGVAAGVPPIACASGRYCWVQRRGPCAGLCGGTTIADGQGVVASTTVAGGFVSLAAAGSALADMPILGFAQNTIDATSYGSIYLTLE